uniref:AlNc14C52G4051 protein n=1 Tax=Albugo laibachii Nc14 TaxID=890382 RepID=F0WBK6_9STRA|nr:AlNc14C52G4051 [Albugo laibachii Nc14]|eukprot:CCA18533.1 AlNc14C52G4051 [Albugo laibachii Nc14]
MLEVVCCGNVTHCACRTFIISVLAGYIRPIGLKTDQLLWLRLESVIKLSRCQSTLLGQKSETRGSYGFCRSVFGHEEGPFEGIAATYGKAQLFPIADSDSVQRRQRRLSATCFITSIVDMHNPLVPQSIPTEEMLPTALRLFL